MMSGFILQDGSDSDSAVKACQQGCVMYSKQDSHRAFFSQLFRDPSENMVKCTSGMYIFIMYLQLLTRAGHTELELSKGRGVDNVCYCKLYST